MKTKTPRPEGATRREHLTFFLVLALMLLILCGSDRLIERCPNDKGSEVVEPRQPITSRISTGAQTLPTLGAIDFAPAYASIIVPAIDDLQAQLMQWEQQMRALADDPLLVMDDQWRWDVYSPLIGIASICNRLSNFRTPDLYAESRAEIAVFCEQTGGAGSLMYAGIEALDQTPFDDGYRLMAVARQHLDQAIELLPEEIHADTDP